MKIVVPMAGRGSRFAKAGVTAPKPLIEVKGKPMIQWAIESIKLIYPDAKDNDFIFICLQEHEDNYQIGNKLKMLVGPNINLIYINEVTDGAACTVLKAKDLINNEEDMLTCDCDQFFRCPQFISYRQQALENNWGGLIPTSEKSSPAYSYIRLDEKGDAVETAEKKQISTHAAIGIYYFTQGRKFVAAAETMIEKNKRINNEFYLCPVYNELIAEKEIVKIVPTDLWMTLGTPDEAKYFAENVPQ